MKKLILLLAVTFSFAIVNAQETTEKKTKTTCTKTKAECAKAKAEGKTCTKSSSTKSCSKECSKSCCASSTSKKECSKSSAKKECSKSSAKKSCSKTSTEKASSYVKKVSPKEFMAYADRFPSEQILDIRSFEEVKASGRIEGAQVVDYNGRDFKQKVLSLDKDAAIMIYCNSGKRSSEATSILKDWGFKKIYEMEGGYKAYLASTTKK